MSKNGKLSTIMTFFIVFNCAHCVTLILLMPKCRYILCIFIVIQKKFEFSAVAGSVQEMRSREASFKARMKFVVRQAYNNL